MKKVFITREFDKSASEITKEEFIQMMLEDIESAKIAFRKWTDEIAKATYQKDNEEYIIKRAEKIEKIIADSYKLYKREFYRLRWVEKEIAKLPEVLVVQSYRHEGRDLTSICWDIKPWDNSCSRIMSDHIKDTMLYTLGHLYNEAIKNKYFVQCSGWSIVGDPLSAEFKLHLSAELQEQWTADEHKLAENIARFYEGCTYWGD